MWILTVVWLSANGWLITSIPTVSTVTLAECTALITSMNDIGKDVTRIYFCTPEVK